MITYPYLLGKKARIMIATTIIKSENIWNPVQEPRGSTYLSNDHRRFLTALDQGWKVVKIELTPSWDQYGFIYLVTLSHQSRKHLQQLILPKNNNVESLIHSVKSTVL
jgi:hypothetical protein